MFTRREKNECGLEPVTLKLMEEMLAGNRRALARLMSMVEDDGDEVHALLAAIHPYTGKAHIIGVTGAPGTGKSTLVNELAQVYDDWGGMIEATACAYKRQAAASNVTLQVRIPAKLPPVQLCELFFVDALGRLVDNGIKFSAGNPVTVSAQVVGGWVEVAVQDEGVGISAADMPHLFERFRQFGREEMEQQGRGLGLAIAQELIHLHGGEIVAASNPGVGSTFTIRLPLAEPE